jgi:light-regulated signal transduction histidine kinase (bacteriophytochrome)
LEQRSNALAKSNEDLNSFARVVTHDLKSPLSTFALNLRLLHTQAEASGDAKEMERIARMERQVVKMDDRIDGILAYSRSRDADVRMTPVALDDVLVGVLDDLAADIGTTGTDLRIEALPTVRGDAQQLAQVLQNLIANAIKFAKPGQRPRVRVWSEPSRTGWAVHIEDQGVGFLPDDVDKMFKPFSRLSNSNGREGHGVGLASCARIMERHGGRLHAQGYPGKGARFTMLLRRADPTAASDGVVRPPRPRRDAATPEHDGLPAAPLQSRPASSAVTHHATGPAAVSAPVAASASAPVAASASASAVAGASPAGPAADGAPRP